MRRLLPILGIAVVLATACGASLSPAIEVNSDEVSRSDLLEQTAALAEPMGFGTASTASGEFTRQLIVLRINELLLLQIADELGVEVTDDHRAQAVEVIETNNGGQFEDPDDLAEFVEVLTPSIAVQIALEEVTSAGEALGEAYLSSDIRVDPRFGTWDPLTGEVLAPAGPVPG